MKIFMFMLIFSTIKAFISILYKKKFMLSIIICLESMLLKLLLFKYMYFLLNKTKCSKTFSLFMLTLSAMEASMSMSLLTLVSRDFSKKNIYKLKILKK